jgi:hypothetical protein
VERGLGNWSDEPRHDIHSHGADAYQTFALGWEPGHEQAIHPRELPGLPTATIRPETMNLNDLPYSQRKTPTARSIEARIESAALARTPTTPARPRDGAGDKDSHRRRLRDRAEGRRAPPEQSATDSKLQREMLLASLGADLQRKAEQRVTARRPVEDRWIQDTRQYHSKYDPATMKKIKDAKGSTVFVNITAPKTDGFAARMADMILPTDGKNWGIKPTPVPEMLSAMHDETPITDGPTGQTFQTPEGNDVQARDVAKGINETLADRCKDMEREMDDQLDECNYNAAQRRGIDQCASSAPWC